jgi:cellulose synthase/poly-beta-1,6-N-acetylglucosamine synthase-like glycosyltransferase
MAWIFTGRSVVIAANLALFFPIGYLFLVTLAATFYRRKLPQAEVGKTRFLIVIPAHNEESGVGLTVQSCRSMDYPPGQFDVLVIADNCGDRTAEKAREAGALVVERSDPSKKTKGFALEYLFAHLAETGDRAKYDAAVVIDADTLVDLDLLRRFSGAISGGADWLQCYYTVRNADQSWRTQLLTYAYSLINGVMSQGQHVLGLGSGLRGNGMAFTFRGMDRIPWSSYGLAEDMEFCWQLRTAGERVTFVPETRVYAEMVSKGGEGAASQRRRWEVGRSKLKGMFTGPLLKSSKNTIIDKLLYLIDLYLPPLARLGLMLLLVTALTLTWSPSAPTLALNGCLWAGLGCYLASPFLLMRLPLRYGLALVYAPFYAFWKVALLLRPKPDAWVRTEREEA